MMIDFKTMCEKKIATIKKHLTPPAQVVAEQLIATSGGTKTLLSAGVIAFDRLTLEQRQHAIAEANGVEGVKLDLNKVPDIDRLWAEVKKIAKKLNMKINIPKDV